MKKRGDKNRKAKNKQEEKLPKKHTNFCGKKTRKQIFTFFLFLFQPSAGSVSGFATSEFLSFFLYVHFYRLSIEKLAIFYHSTRLSRVSALLLVQIKIKFQFKNVQLLEFVFLLLFLDYYQSKTINLKAIRCCFMCWLVHKEELQRGG